MLRTLRIVNPLAFIRLWGSSLLTEQLKSPTPPLSKIKGAYLKGILIVKISHLSSARVENPDLHAVAFLLFNNEGCEFTSTIAVKYDRGE